MVGQSKSWQELDNGFIYLRIASWNLKRSQLDELFQRFNIEESSSGKSKRRNKLHGVEGTLIPWINSNPGKIYLKRLDFDQRCSAEEQREQNLFIGIKRRELLNDVSRQAHESFYARVESKARGQSSVRSISASRKETEEPQVQTDEPMVGEVTPVNSSEDETSDDDGTRYFKNDNGHCWAYFGSKGCKRKRMRLLICNESGEVTVRRELDPLKFYEDVDAKKQLACSTDAEVTPFSFSIGEDPLKSTFELDVLRTIFDKTFMHYLIESSEERRIAELEGDINGVLGSEYYEQIDDGWILKYIAALILFGILGVKSVDDALTKRKNLPTMSKGKKTLQGARKLDATRTNPLYNPYVGKFMRLRKWRMLNVCVRPYLNDYASERERFTKLFDHFESKVCPGATRMENPLGSTDARKAYSWKTNGISQIVQHNSRSVIRRVARNLSLDECRIRSKVHDSRVKRNPSKPIKVGATVHCLAMCDEALMTGYALAWNTQERAGYLSDFKVPAAPNRYLVSADFDENTFFNLMTSGSLSETNETETQNTEEGDAEVPRNLDFNSPEFFELSAGQLVQLNHPEMEYNLRIQSGIVYLLTRFLPENGHCVYTDSWFTSSSLVHALLKNRSIFLTGTFKLGRVDIPLIGKVLNTMKQDEVFSARNEVSGALVTLWKDRKLVRVCTSAEDGKKRSGLLKRQRGRKRKLTTYSQPEKKDNDDNYEEYDDERDADIDSVASEESVSARPEQVDVSTTEAHAAWNKYLRGVDILDSRIAAYNFNRIRRYRGMWPQLFYFDIEVGLANAFLLARNHKYKSRMEHGKATSEEVKKKLRKEYTYKIFLLKVLEQILTLDESELNEEGSEDAYDVDDYLAEIDEQDHSRWWKMGNSVKQGRTTKYERASCAFRSVRCVNRKHRTLRNNKQGERHSFVAPLSRWYCSHPACMVGGPKYFCHNLDPSKVRESCLKRNHDERGYVKDTRFTSALKKKALFRKKEYILERQKKLYEQSDSKLYVIGAKKGKAVALVTAGVKAKEYPKPVKATKSTLNSWLKECNVEVQQMVSHVSDRCLQNDVVKRFFPGNWYSDDNIFCYFRAIDDPIHLLESNVVRWDSLMVHQIRVEPPTFVSNKYLRKVRLLDHNEVHTIVNLCGCHWVFIRIVIHNQPAVTTETGELIAARTTCKIQMYDSLLHTRSYQKDRLAVCEKLKWFIKQMLTYYDSENVSQNAGIVEVEHELVEDVPQQSNGYDCGPFACMFAEKILYSEDFLQQRDITKYRLHMLQRVLENRTQSLSGAVDYVNAMDDRGIYEIVEVDKDGTESEVPQGKTIIDLLTGRTTIDLSEID